MYIYIYFFFLKHELGQPWQTLEANMPSARPDEGQLRNTDSALCVRQALTNNKPLTT